MLADEITPSLIYHQSITKEGNSWQGITVARDDYKDIVKGPIAVVP